MSGFPLGFPVVFDNRLSRNESQRLWTILSNGNFLDEDTASVTVRLLTYNPELQVYGQAVLNQSHSAWNVTRYLLHCAHWLQGHVDTSKNMQPKPCFTQCLDQLMFLSVTVTHHQHADTHRRNSNATLLDAGMLEWTSAGIQQGSLML